MIREDLAQILITYLLSKKGSFESHPLANFIRQTAPNRIEKHAAISSFYKVQGSAGQGNWATIPWICIFDKEITTSAQHGYFIVYLFRADMRGVYLSLNQGWTQFNDQFHPIAEAKKKIQESAIMLRANLNSLAGFDVESIDLATDQVLGRGYELGHICGKYYDHASLPNDLVLIDDLRNLIGVYRELKGKLSGKPLIDELNDYNYERANPYTKEGEKSTKEDLSKVNQLAKEVNTIEEVDSLLAKFEEEMKGQEIKTRQRLANTIVRNQKIAELVKKRAEYICEICKQPGFEKRDGGLYAEVHHKEELARYGKDLPSNMVCVCPLCHRKIHYGKNSSLSSAEDSRPST